VSGASIRIDVSGDDVLERELAALVKAGEDVAPFMDALGLELETNTLDRFDREMDPQGKAWQKSARAAAEGGKTLTDSARLKSSIGYRASADEIIVGTNVVYAAIHQFGFSGAQKVAAHKRRMSSVFGRALKSPIEVVVPEFTRQMDMPQRAFLGFGPEDEASANDMFLTFFGRAAPQMAGGRA
jgi:phage virion morphogenesis protein